MLFGEMLIQRGLVTHNDIAVALEKQRQLRARGVNERLGVVLVLAGALGAESLADTVVDLAAASRNQQADSRLSRSH
jgi:UDP-N-acetylglucosamine:LPS N-acetylglucosamine transferase